MEKKQLAKLVLKWKTLAEETKRPALKERANRMAYLFGSDLIEGSPITNRLFWAKLWYEEDCKYDQGKTDLQLEVAEDIRQFSRIVREDIEPRQWSFITLRYIQENFRLSTFADVIEKLKAYTLQGAPLIDRMHYTHECNTVNGISYHSHILVESRHPPSKIRECLGKTFMGRRNRIISMENMIDVKNSKSRNGPIPYQSAKNYIQGIKREEKMQYVELDKIWRAENNILVKTDFSEF